MTFTCFFTITPMPSRKSQRRSGTVRIIGGRWRGRRIEVESTANMRPTSDRVRETLFNWLMPVIGGTRCLDLFAGTGVLGLEALSRGASETWFVEQDPGAVARLEQALEAFGCHDAKVFSGDALNFLQRVPTAFDLVFLDPPFHDIDIENLCTLLEQGWLAPGAHIYLELSRRSDLPALPPKWKILREKTTAQVRFALARHS